MRRVLSFITSMWSVGLRQISVLSVFRKMWCNSWCNTIFQKVFNAEYYTFAVFEHIKHLSINQFTLV